MSDATVDLLLWARGPGLTLALGWMVFGLLLRLGEILFLGHRPDLAPAKGSAAQEGARCLVSRFLPLPGLLVQAPVTVVGGYLFHVGYFVALFLFFPHLVVVRELLGFDWPAAPNVVVDAATVIALGAMVALLVSRLTDPVKRFLSGFEDYLVWGVTFLPLLTGYLAYHHLLAPYPLMLALHLLSAELLLVLLPFTKLVHTVTVFLARWYTGAAFGRKGVAA